MVEAVYLASGKGEGGISSGYFWDMAASKLIVEEAGGRVTGIDGQPYKGEKRGAVLSNGQIHEKLPEVLKTH